MMVEHRHDGWNTGVMMERRCDECNSDGWNTGVMKIIAVMDGTQ